MRNGKIKILHITEPTIDGVKTHVVDLLSNLNDENYQITLLYSTHRSDPKFKDDLAWLESRGIQTFPCFISGQIRPKADCVAFLNILNFIRNNKFDIVHCHSSKAGFLARLAAKILRVPVIIYTPHAFSFQSNHSHIKSIFYVFLERLAAKFCDTIICVSQEERNVAVRHKIAPKSKFKVIPNAISLKKFGFAEPINLKQNYPKCIDDEDLIIATVGRLSYQKAPEIFVKAAAIVAREFDKAKFLYIGIGELKKPIESLSLKLGLRDRLIFTGYRNDVFALLKSSHIFMLSSRYEGLPYSILEAMALKLPVVATNVTGTSELVINGKTGILVPPEDHEALAKAILDLIKDPKARKKLGEAGYQYVLENYELETMVQLTENLYQSLLCNCTNRKIGTLKVSEASPQTDVWPMNGLMREHPRKFKSFCWTYYQWLRVVLISRFW
jgi:glycosyltransferase involved in cell wall biosynthesis